MSVNVASPGGSVLERERSASFAAVPAWLTYLVIVAAFAGIFFRFYHLGWKVYANDESMTSLRATGYTLSDYAREFDGRVHTAGDLSKFQRVTGGRSAMDTMRGLAQEEPQHPPLYYLAERGWVQLWGNSIAARRSLSALIGALVPFAALWLCIELFGSVTAGLVMLVLTAVSPFHLLYSQTAREYELFALFALITSAALLRAIRTGRPLDWLWYGLSLVVGLYSFSLILYVLFGHAVYAIAFRRQVPFKRFALTAFCAVVTFAPWAYAGYGRRLHLSNNAYLHTPLPLKLFALKWIFNIGAVFFDLDYKVTASAVLLLPIFALLIYAAVDLYRRAPRRVFWFVALLTLPTALAFLIPDLRNHESLSTSSRYLVPTWLGLALMMSFALARPLESAAPHWRRLTAACAVVFLFACGVASDVVSSKAVSWWGDGSGLAIPPIARILDQADRPLVVFQIDPQQWDFSPVMLSNVVRPDVRFQLFTAKSTVRIASHGGTIYVLDPNARLRDALRRSGVKLAPVYEEITTRNAAIAKMQKEAASARSKAGILMTGASLWRVEPG